MPDIILATISNVNAATAVTLQQANTFTTVTVADQIHEVLVPLIPPTPDMVNNVGIDFNTKEDPSVFYTLRDSTYIDQSASDAYVSGKSFSLKAAADAQKAAEDYTDAVVGAIVSVLPEAKAYTDQVNTTTLNYVNNTLTIPTSRISDWVSQLTSIYSYVDDHTWTVSKITDLSSYISAFDFANKTWVNSKTWTVSQITDMGSYISGMGFATASWVNNHTWTTSQITDFDISIKSYNFLTSNDLTDFATKTYVQNGFYSKTYIDEIKITDLKKPTEATKNLDINNNRITNVSDPVEEKDASTKVYTDSRDQAILQEAKDYTDSSSGSFSFEDFLAYVDEMDSY